MTRRLALLRKTTFEEYEGWENCYIQWTPLTYADSLALKDMNTDVDESEGNAKVLELVRDHIAGGKVNVLDDNNEVHLVSFNKSEDLEQVAPDMIMKLFFDITGAQYDDPKASNTTTDSTEPQNNSENATGA